MAEAVIGFAASIAALATFGIQIVTTLNTFATTYSRAEQQINDLSANVALTASILESIGKMIKEYEDSFQLTVDNYIATRDQCERNFNRLWVALKVVKKEESEKPQVKRELRIGGRMGVWAKMKHAMGGADSLKDLVSSIETSKSNLQLLFNSLNYLVLRSLSKKDLLTEDQSEDFKLFMRQLPGLVLGLRQAGLIKVDEGKRKSVENTGTDSANIKMPVGNAALAGSSSQLTSNDPSSGGNHILPANLDPNDTESPNEKAVIEEPSDVEIVRNRDLTPNALDTESIYEGWLLQSKPPKDLVPHAVMVFCGMKFSVYDGESTIDYSVIPFSKDKEILKKRASSSKTKVVSASTEANDNKNMVKHLPKDARREVVKLLNDRNRRPEAPYGWKIAAVEKQTPKPNFWFARRKTKSPPSWLMVLRGGIIEPPSKTPPKRNIALPHRHSNPWRQAPGLDRQLEPILDSSSEYDSDDFSTDSSSHPGIRFQLGSHHASTRSRRVSETVEVRRERSPVRIVRGPERVERIIVEEEMIDDEEAERLMDEYLATFTKDDGKEMEKGKGKEKKNSI